MNLESLPGSYDNNVATTRTTWNTLVILYAIGLLTKYTSLDLDMANLLVPAIIAAIVGFSYRLSIVMSQKFSWWGILLFLINKSPGYTAPPPGDLNEDNVPPPVDRGGINNDTLVTILVVLVIILVVALLFGWINL